MKVGNWNDGAGENQFGSPNEIGSADAKINVFMQEMRDFKDEMRDFKNEMRDRDNQRAEDIREIRSSLQSLQSSGRTLNIATIIGIAAIVIASCSNDSALGLLWFKVFVKLPHLRCLLAQPFASYLNQFFKIWHW